MPGRKSITPVDRAPNVYNRPSSSPVHRLVRPTSAMTKLIGERQRQFSSFTPSGYFPESFGANNAPKGLNEIDKQMQSETKKVERARSANSANRERELLEMELDRIRSTRVIDIITIPPAVDASQSAMMSFTSASSSQRPHSADASIGVRHRAVSPASNALGSRPETPCVFVGGKVQPDLHNYSRPSSAVAAVGSGAGAVRFLASGAFCDVPKVSTTSGISPPALPSGKGHKVPTQSQQVVAVVDSPADAPPKGHLKTIVLAGNSKVPPWVSLKLQSRPNSAQSNASFSQVFPASELLNLSQQDEREMMTSVASDEVHVAQGGDTTRPSSAAAMPVAASSPNRKQRHQTQTKKQQGFNISTSFISHDADRFEQAINSLLRSNMAPRRDVMLGESLPAVPPLVPGGFLQDESRRERTSEARTSCAPVYPLRAIFLS